MEAKESNVRLAVVAGFFATTGSLLGKLAGNVELGGLGDFGLLLTWLTKGILLLAMVTSNTLGCTYFVKALNGSKSSLPATVTSNATSYLCSALAGSLFFSESTSFCWYCGIAMVILGLIFTCKTSSQDITAPAKEIKQS